MEGKSGRLVALRNGRYDNVDISVVTSKKKVLNVEKNYNAKRLRPRYRKFQDQPMFIVLDDLLPG